MFTGFLDGGVCFIAAILGFMLTNGQNKIMGALVAIVCGIIGFGFGLWDYVPIAWYYGFLWFAFVPFMAGAAVSIIDGGQRNLGRSSVIFTTICLLFLFLNVASSSYFRASAVGNLIAPMQVSKDFLKQIDNSKIRLVPKRPALAISKGSLSSGEGDINLGSVLHLDKDHTTIQKVRDSMYWIVPFEYNGWKAQTQMGDIPGFIAVSAYDTNINPSLIDKSPVTGKSIMMKASMNGNFSRFGKRILWKAFPFSILDDFSFEVDDNWVPHIVATSLKPGVGIANLVPDGVKILNLVTLEAKEYDMKSIPKWVDRVNPLDKTLDRINDYGKWRFGFWSNVFENPHRFKATDYDGVDGKGNDLFFVESGDITYWFTGLTSISDKDNSLVGAMFVNTRTNEYFQMPAKGTDEDGVIEAVTGALGNEAMKWTPVQPILYNVIGINSWVVPIISKDTDLWQGVALVQMGNRNNVVWDRDLKSTIRKYLKKVKASNVVDVDVVEKVYAGILATFNLVSVDGNISAIFSLKGHAKAFECSGDSVPECLVLPTDQKLSLTVNDTGEKVLNVISVDGFTLKGSSDREIVLEPQIQTGKTVEDVRNFDALTPAEKAKALQMLKGKK